MTIKSPFTLTAAIAVISLLAACAPQAEFMKTQSDVTGMRSDLNALKANIERIQKRLDALEANLKATVDVQKVMADYGAKSDELTTDIQLLQGKLEENNFRLSELSQKLDDRGVKIAELSARIDDLDARVKALASGEAPMSSVTSTGTSTIPSEKSKPGAKTVEPSDAYRQAKRDFDRGNYDLALAGFQNYITQFPDTSQADKAQYWIGECYYAKKHYDKAIDAFNKVVKNYPKSDKVAGAKLKIGLAYLSEKNHVKAKEYLHRVIKEYPGTDEAKIAKDRLRKIGK